MPAVVVREPPFLDAASRGVKADDSTDNTAALAACFQALPGGRGVVRLRPGVTRGRAVLGSGQFLEGCGSEASILKLPDAANTHVVQTTGWVGLTGTDTVDSPFNFGLRDVTVDGNKAGQSALSHGVAVYGYGYSINGVVIRNCRNVGLHTEWATQSDSPGNDSMESFVSNFKIHSCDGAGVYLRGPHDTQFDNGIVFKCGNFGASDYAIDIPVDGYANGSTFTGVHVWGGRSAYTWRIASSGIMLSGCQGEGGRTGQVLIEASIGVITGCKWFSGGVLSSTTKGIVFANNVNGWRIDSKVENCGGAVLDLGSGGGPHSIDVHAQYYGGVAAPSPAYVGTLDGNTRMNLLVTNGSGVATSDSRLVHPTSLRTLDVVVGHLVGSGSAPTPAAGAAAGASPTGVIVGGGSVDSCGSMQLVTGSGATTGNMMTLTYARPWSSTPFPVVVPGNAATAAMQPYLAGFDQNGFTVGVAAAPTGAGVTFNVKYHVVGRL